MSCGLIHPRRPTCDCPAHSLNPGEHRRSILFAGAGACALSLSFACGSWINHGPTICPFRLMFGIPCPGCGITRSFCAVAHGKFADAFAFHALGPVLFFVMLVTVPLFAYQAILRRRIPGLNEFLFARRPAYAFAAALFTYHAGRLMLLLATGQIWMGFQSSLLMHGVHLICRI